MFLLYSWVFIVGTPPRRGSAAAGSQRAPSPPSSGGIPRGQPTRATLYAERFSIEICIGARASPNIEALLQRFEDIVQTQAQDVVGLATGFARTDNRAYVQNTVTAVIHMAIAATMGILYADGDTQEHASVGLGCRIAW